MDARPSQHLLGTRSSPRPCAWVPQPGAAPQGGAVLWAPADFPVPMRRSQTHRAARRLPHGHLGPGLAPGAEGQGQYGLQDTRRP